MSNLERIKELRERIKIYEKMLGSQGPTPSNRQGYKQAKHDYDEAFNMLTESEKKVLKIAKSA